MIHKLDSKLISKPKKIVIIIVVVVKYLAFIFGNHFAYSSIKIGLKKKKNPTLLLALSVLDFNFSYSTFSQKTIS